MTTTRQQLIEKFWIAQRAGYTADANRLLRLLEKLDRREGVAG